MTHLAEAPDRDLAVRSGDSLRRIRERGPRVHCLTNTVAQALTANMLLAAGAIPAMSMALDEIDDMMAGSGALLINLGTLDEARRAAMARAVAVAAEHGTPWVLDPVMVDRAPARLAFARTLLAQRPAVVRGNSGEVAALGDLDTVVAETGPVDVVRDDRAGSSLARSPPGGGPQPGPPPRGGREQKGAPSLPSPSGGGAGGGVRLANANMESSRSSRAIRLSGGHPLMARVTGLGCAASALVAAFCAVEDDALQAAAQGLLVLGRAAEMAAAAAAGPASFQVALLDHLYSLDGDTLEVTP